MVMKTILTIISSKQRFEEKIYNHSSGRGSDSSKKWYSEMTESLVRNFEADVINLKTT